MTSAVSMGASQRRKGSRWERELASRLREKLYPDAHRGIGQARSGGEVCDVEGTPWWIEAKAGRATNVWAALRQAREATDGRPPLVVAKRDREGVVVCLALEDFEALILAQREGWESQ